MVLGECRELMVSAGIGQGQPVLLQVDIRDPLEEHQREDVGLEVGLVDRPAKQVGCLGHVLLEFRQGDWTCATRYQCERLGADFFLAHTSDRPCPWAPGREVICGSAARFQVGTSTLPLHH